MDKLSYPNFNDAAPLMPIYDIKRWSSAFQNILIKQNLGSTRQQALQEVVGDWSPLEQFNFKNWVKFYESGDQFKYKKAQYYVNDQLSYFVPNPSTKAEPPSPIKSVQEVQQDAANIAQQNKPGLSDEDKRKLIEDQRRKLISRLNSVEKLLGSQQGHMFAGKDFENLLHSIYELKKQIQTINKISLSTQTYVDLMVRQANFLKRNGCNVAANFMLRLAQQTPGPAQGYPGEGAMPMAGSIEQGLGSLDNNTPSLNNLAKLPPLEADPNVPIEGLSGFLENLEGGGLTDGDQLEADDEVLIDDDVILDQEIGPQEEIVVEAQMVENKPTPSKPAPIKPPVQETPSTKINIERTNFDALVDAAFDKLTIQDLLIKLQEIQQIFNRKEISKQLSLADLMFSKLGLTQYFPNFAEVQQKTLDATNYASTRLVDIISKLQSGIGINANTIDISGENQSDSPDVNILRQNLENTDKRERERKQLRKEVENKQIQEKAEKPELTVENPAGELAAEQPVVEAPAAPKPAPAVAPGV